VTAPPGDDGVEALRERLRQYTAERHPLQHATAQFHLGGLLLGRGELEDAEVAFAAAAALFDARGARPEGAKALNGLGATLRAAGRLELAARALEHAVTGLADAGLPLEEGAARFNQGLVLREQGRTKAAAEALARSAELLDPARVPTHAAAAARELGAARLALGELDAAEAALLDAIALADRAADEPGRAAAANTLGLVRLARGDAGAAGDAFATAAAANPRSVRPEAYAMAKANLALACEQRGGAAAARLAARQALAAPEVPAPVRAQAAAVLERLGTDPGDLRAVLEAEGPDGRARLVREELARSADAGEDEVAADMRAWVLAHTASALDPADVAELWLGGLLELPPAALERLAHHAVAAVAEGDRDARDDFRQAVTRAMARFGIPQWLRLQEVFSRAAEAVGDPRGWR